MDKAIAKIFESLGYVIYRNSNDNAMRESCYFEKKKESHKIGISVAPSIYYGPISEKIKKDLDFLWSIKIDDKTICNVMLSGNSINQTFAGFLTNALPQIIRELDKRILIVENGYSEKIFSEIKYIIIAREIVTEILDLMLHKSYMYFMNMKEEK